MPVMCFGNGLQRRLLTRSIQQNVMKIFFILASSHQVAFSVLLYIVTEITKLLGRGKSQYRISTKTGKEHGDIIKNYPQAHVGEHAVEVQLPFLQYKLGTKFQIVPIILGLTIRQNARNWPKY